MYKNCQTDEPVLLGPGYLTKTREANRSDQTFGWKFIGAPECLDSCL